MNSPRLTVEERREMGRLGEARPSLASHTCAKLCQSQWWHREQTRAYVYLPDLRSRRRSRRASLREARHGARPNAAGPNAADTQQDAERA